MYIAYDFGHDTISTNSFVQLIGVPIGSVGLSRCFECIYNLFCKPICSAGEYRLHIKYLKIHEK